MIDLKLPWSLAQQLLALQIIDADGTVIASMWRGASNDNEYQPSPREDIDEDEICDNHYENIVVSVNEWKAEETKGGREAVSVFVWVCDKCAVEVREFTGATEVTHRCKGKPNQPMRRKAEDDER